VLERAGYKAKQKDQIPQQAGTNVWNLNAPSPVADKPNWWEQVSTSWWEDSDNATEYNDSINTVASNPRYVREEQTFLKDNLNVGIKSDTSGRVFYRVTARGVGVTGQTKSILQSTYTRRF
jgi:type IV pilus assembly protein PilX